MVWAVWCGILTQGHDGSGATWGMLLPWPFPSERRHRQGLVAAWTEQKPGPGTYRQIVVSFFCWSYCCWHLQPRLCTGPDELDNWKTLFEETPCSIKYHLYLIIFKNPWEKVNLTLKRVGKNENMPGERIKHFYYFPSLRKCLKHRSQSWGTTWSGSYTATWLIFLLIPQSDHYCIGQNTSQ